MRAGAKSKYFQSGKVSKALRMVAFCFELWIFLSCHKVKTIQIHSGYKNINKDDTRALTGLHLARGFGDIRVYISPSLSGAGLWQSPWAAQGRASKGCCLLCAHAGLAQLLRVHVLARNTHT